VGSANLPSYAHPVDVEHLLDMLASPDPVVRDETACRLLVERIHGGELDYRLVNIGDAMVGRFGHPEIQARAFAPLVLAAITRRSIVDSNTVRE
jgi:hypothetical protein